MNKIKITIAGLLLALAAWFVGGVSHPLGSAVNGQQYNSTTTRSTSASATLSYAACLGSGTFGSIVVTQPATAGYVAVYDATTTATSTIQTTSLAASTLTYGKPIAKVLSASDVVGTLTYDVQFSRGVVVETSSGFDGEYLISCKN